MKSPAVEERENECLPTTEKHRVKPFQSRWRTRKQVLKSTSRVRAEMGQCPRGERTGTFQVTFPASTGPHTNINDFPNLSP